LSHAGTTQPRAALEKAEMLSIYVQEETGGRRKLRIEVVCDVIFIKSYYMGYVVDIGKIRN
jgi:hypothetical protein